MNEIQNLAALVQKRVATQGEAKMKIDMLLTLLDLMKDDIVHFEYEKKSGEFRSAYGTRNPDIIHKYRGDPEGVKSNPSSTFNYFDLQRKGWRSFRPETILFVYNSYTI